MPKISAYLLLLTFILSIFFLTANAYAEDWQSLARNEIGSAEWQIQEATEISGKFWEHISDYTQREAQNDVNLALADLRMAKSYLQENNDNMSLHQACNSLFLAARSKYRVYLNMTNLRIQEVNETIGSIPWYLGKPLYAIDVLQNATKIYEDQNIPSYFTSDLYAEDVSQHYESTQYVVYTRIEEAIQKLYLNDQSAYNLAIKAESLAIAYQNEQNQIVFWAISVIGISLGVIFVTGVMTGVLLGPRVRRYISNWKTKHRRINIPFEPLSDTERRYCLIIVETSGVLVTAILTLGAITGAVTQQIKFVYVFIGYMFGYALPFILSAIIGMSTLYINKRRSKFPDLYDSTMALFISGWFGLAWLFGLSKDYESLTPGWYFIIPITGILLQFGISLGISFIIVYLLNRIIGRRSRKYVSLLQFTKPSKRTKKKSPK